MSATLAGCDLLGDPDAQTAAPTALRTEHLVSLSRNSCTGCPDDWAVQPCTFLDVLRQDGSGSTAALCRNVDSQRPPRKFPPDVTDLVDARVAEALPGAARSTDDALRLFAFGNDLHRLGQPELWLLGDTVQAAALDLLTEARPDATWPGQLVRLVEGGVHPVRITDVAIGDAIAATRLMGPGQQAGIAKASGLATEAIRSPEPKRLGVMLSFADAYAWSFDVVDTWAAGEQARARAMELGIGAALAARKDETCPASLDVLVPTAISHLPEGWTVDAATCTPRPPREPPARTIKEPPPEAALPSPDLADGAEG